MALFFIEAVRFDDSGERVAKVRWGRSKGGQVMLPAVIDEAQEVDVLDVLKTLREGDEVVTKFQRNDSIILGPKVVGIVYEDGLPGLSMETDEVYGNRLTDLPQF